MLVAKYEVEVWTPDGEYNVMFQDYQEALVEYKLAVEVFGKGNVTLHTFGESL